MSVQLESYSRLTPQEQCIFQTIAVYQADVTVSDLATMLKGSKATGGYVVWRTGALVHVWPTTWDWEKRCKPSRCFCIAPLTDLAHGGARRSSSHQERGYQTISGGDGAESKFPIDSYGDTD